MQVWGGVEAGPRADILLIPARRTVTRSAQDGGRVRSPEGGEVDGEGQC